MFRKNDEIRIAEEIVSVLPGLVARACSADREAIRYTVNGDGLKLRSVVLNRASLRRLLDDPTRDVKIEYLQRDLAGSAVRRAEFQYPRVHRIDAPPYIGAALPLACSL